MENDHLPIGHVLRLLRDGRKFSQEEFAFRATLDRRFIGNLERDVQQPTFTSLYKIAKALEIRPSELMKAIEENLDENDQFWQNHE